MLYALITGASKGIGKAMAEELASRNINLLLVARSEALLEAVSVELATKYPIKTAFLSIDLSAEGAPALLYDWVMKNGFQVNILINNAGYGLGGAFERYTADEHLAMMRVNMQVPVALCALFLPQLKQQPKSYILNIASSAAYQSVPGLSVYAASKAFVLSFSRGIAHELRKTNVSVTVVSPGGTDSDFANRAQVGDKAVKAGEKLNMSAEAVARLAIDAMFAGKREIITGFVNKLGAFLVWLLPKKLAETTAAGLYGIK